MHFTQCTMISSHLTREKKIKMWIRWSTRVSHALRDSYDIFKIPIGRCICYAPGSSTSARSYYIFQPVPSTSQALDNKTLPFGVCNADSGAFRKISEDRLKGVQFAGNRFVNIVIRLEPELKEVGDKTEQ